MVCCTDALGSFTINGKLTEEELKYISTRIRTDWCLGPLFIFETWTVTKNRDRICPYTDRVDLYDHVESLKKYINKISSLKKGYIINGIVVWKRDHLNDRGIIVIKDNKLNNYGIVNNYVTKHMIEDEFKLSFPLPCSIDFLLKNYNKTVVSEKEYIDNHKEYKYKLFKNLLSMKPNGNIEKEIYKLINKWIEINYTKK